MEPAETTATPRLAAPTDEKNRSVGTRRTSRWVNRGVALAIFALAGGLAYWLGLLNGQGQTLRNGGLVIAHDRLNFGEQWEQSAFVWELQVENPTRQEIKVAQFVSSCICSKIEPEALVLAPGGEAKVRLTLDLRHYSQGEEAMPLRDFDVELTPIIAGLPPQPGWKVQGRVRTALTAMPRFVDFGTKLIRGQPFPKQTVKLHVHIPKLKLVVKENPLLSVQIVNLIESPDQYEVTITPRQDVPAGKLSTQLVLEPIGPNAQVLPVLTIPVIALMRESIEAIPGTLVLGVRAIDLELSETIILNSLNGSSFEVIAAKSDCPETSVCPMGKVVAGKQTFQVKQRITKLGQNKEIVEFTIRIAGEETPVCVRVPVIYKGAPAVP